MAQALTRESEQLPDLDFLDPKQYFDRIDWYNTNPDLRNRFKLLYAERDKGHNSFDCVDTDGVETPFSPTITFGHQAIALKYKNKLGATLYFRVENDTLIVHQIIGEENAKVGFILDYRALLLLAIEEYAKTNKLKQIIILCGNNQPYYHVGFPVNNYMNSTDIAERMGYNEVDKVGNRLKRLRIETQHAISMVDAE